MTKTPPPSRAGDWFKRLALAAAAPIVAVVALESALRLFGFGHPTSLFVPDRQPGFLRTNPDYAGLFLPNTFDLRPLNLRLPRKKEPGALRVFVLGESAAQGVPVPAFGFAQVLRAQLRAHYPGRTIEVINTGIVAVNSHVVRRIAEEAAGLEPDLFVVYMGNNEVVGPYGPGCAYMPQSPPLWLVRAGILARSTRLGQLAQALVARFAGRPAEWGGMSMFTHSAVAGDDPRLAGVYRNFGENLEAVVDAASASGAKVVLSTVVANLKDCAPFLSLNRPGLGGAEAEEWRRAFEGGRALWRLGDPGARGLLREALKRDPHHAETLYLLGRIDLAEGNAAGARAEFLDALHWDALRFRPDPEINRVIRSVAASRPAVVLVDAAAEFGADAGSSGEPCGHEALLEHVHFDWPGNVRLGSLLYSASVAALEGLPGAAPLDPAACADALGYTPHERLPMLLRIGDIVRKQPFGSQATYVLDEASLGRAISRARADASSPAVLEHARRVDEASLASDPANPYLVGILEGVRSDQGDLQAALDLARRAEELAPEDPGMAADRAGLLLGLGRVAEASAAVEPLASSRLQAEIFAPALVEVWSRAALALDGRERIRLLRANQPSLRLRLLEASLGQAGGDKAGAEAELRAVLRDEPSSADALEALVALLSERGAKEEVATLSMASFPAQPSNQANDVRAADAFGARGDTSGATAALEAAEHCGPVTATFELTLALRLYNAGRWDPMIERLALARDLSLGEGSPPVTASIESLISRMMREREAARTGSR